MSDNYENYESSSTYGEDDSYGGGEQIATAVYLNEQLQQQTQAIQNKQNIVILQPTDPPLNPMTGDMWIDTSYFPHTIYSWDGTQWARASVISPDEIGSYSIAEVDDNLGKIQLDMESVSTRTGTIEEILGDDEGLSSRVISSTTYQTDRDEAIDQKITDFETAVNLGQYAKQSELVNTANDIAAKFKSGGGVNLLKNSVGYAGLLNWQVMSGFASQYLGSDAIESGSGLTITTGTIKQAISVVAGQPYTITAKIKKGTAGTAYMKISDGVTFQQVNMINTAAYDYTPIQIAGFVPSTNSLIIELSATGVTGGAIFTAVMVNNGGIGLQWSHANGEMYNSAVTFDINGIQVNSNVYDGYTVMSPEEFSGYFRNNQGVMQKVFTLNKDVTEVAKLKVTDQNAHIEMGSIKMVYVNGGGYSGWSFIPSS